MSALTVCRAAILLGCVTTLMLGCAHAPPASVNWSHPSANQDSRVQFIVVHATEIDFPTSLKVLTHGDVSSHYLIDRDGTVYGLVPENRRAWHAGPSYWQGSGPLNPSSIGIEIVSVPLGMPEGTEAGFPDAQVSAAVRLIADIAKRHGVRPDRIVGHGEVQPDGRTDPGKLFPWARLVARGLVPYPDPVLVEQYRQSFTAEGPPDIPWLQERLSQHGYQMTCSGLLDTHTQRVLTNFQGRYRQSMVSGEPDLETVAILAALTHPDGLLLSGKTGADKIFHADPALHPRCQDR